MDRSVGIFAGIRFVLFGFDPVSEGQYRLELTQKGGVDLGKYDQRCTHLIVSGLIYDDPVCVLARNEGKNVVNETWVDDSLDLGNLADPTRVLYRPVKDLNGIPGAQSLYICLTGYQRQERDDIMRMVGLMGARFCKPLIANQVTHLICYKFEGEKYELAKRVDIKLVNHRWLEDCLKAWAVQPEESYTKSGYELELEAEARDSDEETDDDVAPVQNYHAFNAHTPSVIPNPSLKSPAPNRLSQNSNLNLKSPTAPNRPSPNSNLSLKSPTPNGPSPNSNLNLKSPAPNGPSPNSNLRLKSPVPNGPSQNSNLNLKSPTAPHRPSQNSNSSIKSASPSSHRDIDARESKNSFDMKPNGSEKSPTFITGDQNLNETTTPLQNPGSRIKSPAPSPANQPSPTNNTALQHSGSRIKSPVPSPANEPSTTNNTAHSDPCIKSPAPSPANEPSPTNSRTYIGSEKKINAPSKKSPLVSSNHTPNTPKPSSPHGDNGLEKSPVVAVKPASITQERDNMVTPKSSDGKSQNLAKTPFQEIGSAQGSGSTNIAQYGTDGKSVKTPQTKSGKGFNTPVRNMLDGTKHATPNLSENTEIGSDKQIDSTNVVQTGIKGILGATPQSGKMLSSSYKPPLIKTPSVMTDSDQSGTKKDQITPQCKQFSPNACEPGSSSLNGTKKDQITPPCKGFTSSVSSKGTKTTTSSKLSYTRKKSISPVEQPISRSENVEMEKAVLPQKRKACDESNSDSPFVANDFKELEQMDASAKGDKLGSGVTGMTTTGTRPVRKTLSQKRTSLKRAKPPLNKNSDAKMEEAIAQQPNVNNDIGSSFKEKAPEAVTPVPDNNGDIEMRNVLKESKKQGETKPRTLEIKGLSPESMEIDSKVPGYEKSNENNNNNNININNKLAPSTRIKKAVAKRSIKSAQANHGTNSFTRKLGNNNTDADAAKNPSTEMGTDKKNRKDKLKEIITKEENRKDKLKEIITKEGNNSGAIPGTDKKTGKDRAEVSERSKSTSNKSNITMDWLLTSLELDPEKENKQDDHDHDKSNKKAAHKINKRPDSSNNRQVVESVGNGNGRIVAGADSLECFILSGHTLQKKEFQGVIRKLRGRLCRDSHNWSFQATHFIVPEALRRTEKFFAAAASGRWILKMEYLTASLEAGRFVEEEEYEWYGTGLTEDSTISLEAPRKWRLLRERTGHGAFYGMRILVYGQCIAPKLDTLKRVIKAGDGTVVATCPPYGRFIKSGVDLCVVPDTTPSDDPWIHEFLNNKIPCVTSDFLVEFVCKPGHSLSKHVLFETHDWADQILQKFEKLSQEVVRPLILGENKNEEDLECVVCGLSDRGEVMLICGDERGEIGCGLGTHIDCCNPKLKRVPEEDWFCDSCRALIACNKRTKRRAIQAK
ncbi:hypothetical protein LUZ60_013283 [Juncus effusus]|nr:hypothetical protein LUZ60_013283 [Juncus effusus]